MLKWTNEWLICEHAQLCYYYVVCEELVHTWSGAVGYLYLPPAFHSLLPLPQ